MHGPNVPPMSICFVGTPAPDGNLEAFGLVEYWPSLPSLRQRPETSCPALLLVRLDQPDQYSPDEIAWLFEQFPSSRIICAASPWCASINRSRGLWPVSVIMSEEELEDRLELEQRILQGDAPPIPVTGDREESVRSRLQAQPLAVSEGRSAMVLGANSATNSWIRDLLQSLGVQADTSVPPSNSDWFIIDGDPWNDAARQWLQTAKLGRLSSQVLVITGELEPRCHPAGSCGVRVLSKFASLAEWSRALHQLLTVLAVLFLAGCSQPSPSNSEGAGETWAKQLQAIRAKTSNRLEVSTPVSPEQWQELKSGCETLEILEVANMTLSDADLEVLTPLPNLRRVTLRMPVSDDGAAILARCPVLSQVNLPLAEMTDAGLEQLAKLPLRQLRLGSHQVTDAGLASLKDQPELRFVHLINVPMTDAGLAALAEIKSLQSLYLDHTHCTDEGLTRFLKARPDIHFHRDQMHLPGDPNADRH